MVREEVSVNGLTSMALKNEQKLSRWSGGWEDILKGETAEQSWKAEGI